MTVVGLDLSLTSTGYATATRTARLRPKAVKDDAGLPSRIARLRWVRRAILQELVADLPTLVVVEGPSHGSTGGHEHERGGLWWSVLDVVEDAGIAVMVATPTMIKKYATGKGNADKDLVLTQTVRRFPWFEGGNDESDALWACAMGHAHLGEPLVELPPANQDALKTWA